MLKWIRQIFLHFCKRRISFSTILTWQILYQFKCVNIWYCKNSLDASNTNRNTKHSTLISQQSLWDPREFHITHKNISTRYQNKVLTCELTFLGVNAIGLALSKRYKNIFALWKTNIRTYFLRIDKLRFP